ILLLVVASIIAQLQLSAWALALMVWAFIAASYGFAVVLPLGAHYGHRGLKSEPPFLNRVVYFGNTIGALGLLIGAILLVWGAYAAL
ncbi:MAG: hypothetical protein ACRD6I_18555, partial [Candidatus Acidiferrales bacterium]